ncbi:hypothetical protein D9M73_250050 [compost metagenome]
MGIFFAEPVICSRDGEADRQAFDIPLPGGGKGFVEIIDVKNQIALGCREQSEVQQVTITARLYPNAGVGEAGQVMNHQSRRTAQEGEGAAQHASIAHGH